MQNLGQKQVNQWFDLTCSRPLSRARARRGGHRPAGKLCRRHAPAPAAIIARLCASTRPTPATCSVAPMPPTSAPTPPRPRSPMQRRPRVVLALTSCTTALSSPTARQSTNGNLRGHITSPITGLHLSLPFSSFFLRSDKKNRAARPPTTRRPNPPQPLHENQIATTRTFLTSLAPPWDAPQRRPWNLRPGVELSPSAGCRKPPSATHTPPAELRSSLPEPTT